jgi:hypothetical protein
VSGSESKELEVPLAVGMFRAGGPGCEVGDRDLGARKKGTALVQHTPFEATTVGGSLAAGGYSAESAEHERTN